MIQQYIIKILKILYCYLSGTVFPAVILTNMANGKVKMEKLQ